MMQNGYNYIIKSVFAWKELFHSHSISRLSSLCGAALQLSTDVWLLLLLWHPQCVAGSVPGGKEGQAVAYRTYWSVFIDHFTWCCLSSEPDLSQCNSQQDSRLCRGHGHDPPAVQSAFCCPFLGVSSPHADASFLIRGFGECLTRFLGLPIRSVVVTLMSGFLIDKLGNFCKFVGVLFTNLWCWFDHNFVPPLPPLQLEYICSPFCVFWAHQCLHWAPTLMGLPTCCLWCSRADCSSERAVDLLVRNETRSKS